ncbi:10479_t:CDS:2 [Funneliformis geosporum]|uniref:3320_t:CDS:1 n=1 Tax=Funneliformis geosporum TaxID=1117311 RepID=A0A9W4SJ66_9GLOM|nr:10479_t:CDS:2 [Funneliformis geosporum]CAI2170387.1 3320_t:CDS:2 [Funneliformis geosporum]
MAVVEFPNINTRALKVGVKIFINIIKKLKKLYPAYSTYNIALGFGWDGDELRPCDLFNDRKYLQANLKNLL